MIDSSGLWMSFLFKSIMSFKWKNLEKMKENLRVNNNDSAFPNPSLKRISCANMRYKCDDLNTHVNFVNWTLAKEGEVFKKIHNKWRFYNAASIYYRFAIKAINMLKNFLHILSRGAEKMFLPESQIYFLLSNFL